MNSTERYIVITGAARGIGKALAHALARDSRNHLVLISRNSDALNEIEKELRGTYIYSVAGDLISDLSSIVARIRERVPRVDVLVNNAGVLINQRIADVDEVSVRKMLDTNFTAPVLLTRALLPMMSAGSHIVNIGSMGGYQGSSKFPGLSIYSSTKGALAIFSECLAEELKEEKIAVNCLALGSVQTEMLAEAFPGYTAQTSAEGMGEWVARFATEGHQWFNGKVLPVSVQTP